MGHKMGSQIGHKVKSHKMGRNSLNATWARTGALIYTLTEAVHTQHD